MKWLRNLYDLSWVCGRYKVRIVGRQYVLEHPDLPRKLKYDHPTLAQRAAFLLWKGGIRQ